MIRRKVEVGFQMVSREGHDSNVGNEQTECGEAQIKDTWLNQGILQDRKNPQDSSLPVFFPLGDLARNPVENTSYQRKGRQEIEEPRPPIVNLYQPRDQRTECYPNGVRHTQQPDRLPNVSLRDKLTDHGHDDGSEKSRSHALDDAASEQGPQGRR